MSIFDFGGWDYLKTLATRHEWIQLGSYGEREKIGKRREKEKEKWNNEKSANKGPSPPYKIF